MNIYIYKYIHKINSKLDKYKKKKSLYSIIAKYKPQKKAK